LTTNPSSPRESLIEYIDHRIGPNQRSSRTSKASPSTVHSLKRYRAPSPFGISRSKLLTMAMLPSMSAAGTV